MPENRIRPRKTNRLKAFLFFFTLIFFMIFSFLFFLRPTISYREKRQLAKFPDFSFTALASGSYFDDIETWFSDTYPCKDFFVTVNGSIKQTFGFGSKVYGDIKKGDEIPTTPYSGSSSASGVSSENDASSGG